MITIKEVNTIKSIIVRLDDELHKELKIITIENDTSIQKIVEQFLKDYVKDHQRKQKCVI